MNSRNDAPKPVDPNRDGAMKPRAVALWKCACWGALLIFLLPTLWFPLHRDAGTFALGGVALARSDVLYRDFWDNKPPAVFWTYALPARFFPGQLAGAIYALNALVLLASAALLARLSRPMSRANAGLGAGAWLVVLTLAPGFSNLAQAETFAGAAILGAALWAVSDDKMRGDNPRGALWLSLGAGILAGAAVLFKPTCILPLLPLLFWRKRALSSALLFAIGGAVPLGATFFWLRSTGGWNAYLEIQRLFLAPYLRDFQPSFADHALGLLAHGAFWAATLWLASIFAVFALLDRDKTARRANIFFALSFAGGFAALWLQNRAFAYQWTPMLPAFALLAASGSASLGEKLGWAPRRVSAFCVLCPMLWGAWHTFPAWQNWLTWRSGHKTHAAYLATFNTLDEAKTPSALPAAFQTARYIRARTRPDDTIFVWAFEPEIYLESGRRAPNRFYLHPPLIATFAPQKWRDEAWQSLEKSPPRFIVIARGDDNRWIGAPRGDSATLWRRAAIYPWFSRHFKFAARFGRFDIYHHNTAAFSTKNEATAEISTVKTASR